MATIIEEVSKYMFIRDWLQSETYKNNFTMDGLDLLYEYLTEHLCHETQIRFDMVALACEFYQEDDDDGTAVLYHESGEELLRK